MELVAYFRFWITAVKNGQATLVSVYILLLGAQHSSASFILILELYIVKIIIQMAHKSYSTI